MTPSTGFKVFRVVGLLVFAAYFFRARFLALVMAEIAVAFGAALWLFQRASRGYQSSGH